MTDEDRRPFALSEERTIKGVSYTCVRIDRSGNADRTAARLRVLPGGLCKHCPFQGHLNNHRACDIQCVEGDQIIVTTSLVPTLALEGLLT